MPQRSYGRSVERPRSPGTASASDDKQQRELGAPDNRRWWCARGALHPRGELRESSHLVVTEPVPDVLDELGWTRRGGDHLGVRVAR